MAITRLFKCKDFEPKWKWNGSRLADQPAGFYTVIYKGEDGKQYHDMECFLSSKKEAYYYISQKVKKANAVLKKANEVGKVCLK